MNRKAVSFARLVVIVLWLASAGDAQSQAAAPAPNAPAADDGLGADVLAAGKRWAGGDPEGRRKLEDLARADRADAQELLAEVLSRGGFSGPADMVTACGYFLQASRTRPDALHSLAHCAEIGVGGTPDFPRAAELYQQAADRGFAKSMCALGNLYIAGQGVPEDAKKGAMLCRQGAEAGDEDAQTDLGNLYLRGIGVPHDMVQARHWYELAAAQGQANAEFVLGQIYWNGDGVTRDQAKAAELWKAAYDGGRTDAAELLANWTFARWMAAHPKGDVSGLDEAVAWEQAAVKAARDEQARTQDSNMLKLMLAAREASMIHEK